MWATLQRWYPLFPGSVPPHPKYDATDMRSIPRLVKWWKHSEDNPDVVHPAYPRCRGVYQRGVCVLGVGDLGWVLGEGSHLFANKFDLEMDSQAVACLDEWLLNKTVAQASEQDIG